MDKLVDENLQGVVTLQTTSPETPSFCKKLWEIRTGGRIYQSSA
jgi:hypothetical protein